MAFNHNDYAQPNGNWFALPVGEHGGEIEILSVPWDATVSYKTGAARAPEAIIDASVQVDLFDVDVKEAWKIEISNKNIALSAQNRQCRMLVEQVIKHLEQGGDQVEVSDIVNQVNKMSEYVNEAVYEAAKSIIEQGKTAAVVGGDHSVPFGLIKAVAEHYPNLGILHIDAHADLRHAYEGFEYSHASIMYNVLTKIHNIKKIVQVAVRDFCEEEFLLAQENKKIHLFTDSFLQENRFAGETWSEQCEEIIKQLPQNVYISFDIDGLQPHLCPNTGTPVPGGLDFAEAMYLLKKLATSGRKIVGFDLCEVAPAIDADTEWDANVAARTLFKLCCYTHHSQQIKF